MKSGFRISLIAGFIFILMGIAAFLLELKINLPIDLTKAQVIIHYLAAIGSVIGGILLMFRKGDSSSTASIPSSPKI